MAAITIRNLDDSVKQQLRERAAKNSRSMEAEARAALIDYVAHEESPIEYDLATRIRERLAELDVFVEFELPERSMDMPRSPTSDE